MTISGFKGERLLGGGRAYHFSLMNTFQKCIQALKKIGNYSNLALFFFNIRIKKDERCRLSKAHNYYHPIAAQRRAKR